MLKSSKQERNLSGGMREVRLPVWSRPGFLIRRLHQIHYALFFEECSQYKVTPVQYGVLTALAFRGELDQVSLAGELGLDRTTAAQVLARLKARQLVSRRPNPQDRRAKLARITPRGRKAIADMFTSMQRSQDRLCAPLTQSERDLFMATLVRLIEANNEYGRGALRMD